MSGRLTVPVCRWCGGGHEIEHCPAVLAAFVPGYDPYQGNASSSTATNPRKFRGRALTGRKQKVAAND